MNESILLIEKVSNFCKGKFCLMGIFWVNLILIFPQKYNRDKHIFQKIYLWYICILGSQIIMQKHLVFVRILSVPYAKNTHFLHAATIFFSFILPWHDKVSLQLCLNYVNAQLRHLIYHLPRSAQYVSINSTSKRWTVHMRKTITQFFL